MQFNITKTIEENKGLVDTKIIYNKTFKRFEEKVGENWVTIDSSILKKIISEPTGFSLLNNETDIYSSIISFSVDGTRILSITPTNEHFIFYVNGKEYIKTDVSQVRISDIEGLHYIYFNEDGVLESKLDFSMTDIMKKYASVATVYWDYTNKKAIYIGDKRHGLNTDAYQNFLDFIDDKNIDYIEGTGLKFTSNKDGSINNKVDGEGDSNYHISFSIDAGKYKNYDLINNSEHIEFNENLPIFYKQTMSQEKNWVAMAKNNTTIVAISNDGEYRFMYSEDGGETWKKTYLPYYSVWTDIIYADNKFVAIASEGDYVVTISNDGKTWTPINVSQKNKWQKICYGNGTFIVVGLNGINQIMTSSNGILWTPRETPNFLPLKSVTHVSDNKFIAVCEEDINKVIDISSKNIAISKAFVTEDKGITWTNINISQNKNWQTISFNNGKYIGLSNSTGAKNKLLVTNSINILSTYQMIDQTFDNQDWMDSNYLNNYYLAVSKNGEKKLARSVNGTVWETYKVKDNDVNEWHKIATNNTDRAVLISRNGTEKIAYSVNNGTSWATTNLQDSKTLEDIVYGSDKWVTVSSANSSGSRISWSPNLTTWNEVSNFDTNKSISNIELKSIAYGNSKYLAVGMEDKSWKILNNTPSASWKSIVFGNNIFVAIANDGNKRLATSTDGITWTSRDILGNNSLWESIAFGNNIFIAVASYNPDIPSANLLGISSDGINWTTVTVNQNKWKSIAFNSGAFVAVSSDGTDRVMKSTDNGQTWQYITVELNEWVSITSGNGNFIAVANKGVNNKRVIRSIDGGTTWNSIEVPDEKWSSITFGAGIFMAIENDINDANYTSKNLLKSIDGGMTWERKTDLPTAGWINIYYANATFIAIAFNKIAISNDGVTWEERTLSFGIWLSMAFGKNTFVSVSLDQKIITDYTETVKTIYSTDGIVWLSNTIVENKNWIKIKYLKDYFFALNTDNEVYYSADGLTNWKKIIFPLEILNAINIKIVDFATSNLLYIFSTNTNKLISINAINIEDQTKMQVINIIDNLSFTDIIADEDGQIVIANKETNVMTSADTGFNWIIKNIQNAKINKVKYINSFFILLGDSDVNRIFYSTKSSLFNSYIAINETIANYAIVDLVFFNSNYIFLNNTNDKRIFFIPQSDIQSGNLQNLNIQKRDAIRDVYNSWRRIDDDSNNLIKNRCILKDSKINFNKVDQQLGIFSLEVCNDNKFYLYHVFMSNDKDNKYCIIAGNYEYDNIEEAKNSIIDEINKLSGLPFNDFLPLGSILFQVNNNYSNSVKARIVNINGNNYYKLIKKDLVIVSNNLSTPRKDNIVQNNNLLNNADLINLYGNKILEYALNKLQNLTNRDIDNFITRKELTLNIGQSISIVNIFGTQITGSYEIFDKNNPEIGMILFLKQNENAEPNVNITSYSSLILPTDSSNDGLGVYIDINQVVNFKNFSNKNILNLVIYRKI